MLLSVGRISNPILLLSDLDFHIFGQNKISFLDAFVFHMEYDKYV